MIKIVKENFITAEIEEATNGNELVEKVSMKNDWDMIISDNSMPGLTGIQAAREIEKINENIPIILISAYPIYAQKYSSPLPKNIVCFIEKDQLIDKISFVIDALLEKDNNCIKYCENKNRKKAVFPLLIAC